MKKNTIFEKNEGQREKIQDQEEKKISLEVKTVDLLRLHSFL